MCIRINKELENSLVVPVAVTLVMCLCGRAERKKRQCCALMSWVSCGAKSEVMGFGLCCAAVTCVAVGKYSPVSVIWILPLITKPFFAKPTDTPPLH